MKYSVLLPCARNFNKKTFVTAFLMFFNGLTFAQYVVIENSDMSGENIQLQDTLLMPVDPLERTCLPDGTEYYMDLDNDNIKDVKFRLFCERTPEINNYSISVTTYNDFNVHIDNDHIEHFQYIDPETNTVCDSVRNTPVVKRYDRGDTIYYNTNASNGPIYMHNMTVESFQVVVCVVDNIYLFAGMVGYVAFTKNVSGSKCIYYIKMSLSTEQGLQLMSAKTDDITYGIEDKVSSSDVVFPNPASDKIRMAESYDRVEIYSLHGSIIMIVEQTERHDHIDISGIPNGYYILIGSNEKKKTVSKLLKTGM